MSSSIIYFLFTLDVIKLSSGYISTYNGTIAGNRTLLECVSDKVEVDADLNLSMVGRVKNAGYPFEEHIIVTEDGYLLTIHRIPGKSGAPPVLLQHGLLSSSFDWTLLGKGKSFVFLLADHGYDVWMGNSRGNTYSRCHTTFDTSDSEFWNFTWHEMGIYDVPATITYITNITNQRIIYVGHSMGSTMSYVMAIKKPAIASKVKVLLSIAPVAYLTHSESSLTLFAALSSGMELFTTLNGEASVLSQDPILKPMIHYMCSGAMWQRRICAQILFSVMGYDEERLDYDLLPIAMNHFPSGSSLKAFIHYFQVKNSERFQHFDFGSERNLEIYSNSTPPEYNISKIELPVVLIWSENDYFTHELDVKKLKEQLPNVAQDFKVDYPNFNHLDFLIATDAKKMVYDRLLSIIENYRQ